MQPATSADGLAKNFGTQAQERRGYPTQKPLALLERIVHASSKPGEVILDPFCGCGTTLHAAEKLGRNWIGIDITHIAVQVIEDRLKRHFPKLKPEVIGRPQGPEDARDLARRDKYQFQWWAVWLAGGHPRGDRKKGADRGIDGEIFFPTGVNEDGYAIISVKGGRTIGPDMIREVRGVVHRENADAGIFVCLEPPTKEMLTEAAAAGFLETWAGRFPKIQIRTVEQLLNGQKPNLPPHYDILGAASVARRPKQKPRPALAPEELKKQRQFLLTIGGGSGRQGELQMAPAPEQLRRKRPA
jgi:adenine specific DNA methylase Mod